MPQNQLALQQQIHAKEKLELNKQIFLTLANFPNQGIKYYLFYLFIYIKILFFLDPIHILGYGTNT